MELFKDGKMVTYSCASRGSAPLELYKETTRNAALSSDMTGVNGARLDADFWLPAAAECYNLSKDLRDYIMVPVPTIVSDMPNTNGVAFPKDELLRFDPEMGQLAYKGFKGKPTYSEHANQDMTQAKGVILDAFVTPLRGWGQGFAKVVELLSFDRSKDPVLANQILSGERNCYSMGAYFEGYTCSKCGAERGRCRHTGPKETLYRDTSGELVYRRIYKIVPFETSSVGSPAFIYAVSDRVMSMAT
jgi:hypothetical protein